MQDKLLNMSLDKTNDADKNLSVNRIGETVDILEKIYYRLGIIFE